MLNYEYKKHIQFSKLRNRVEIKRKNWIFEIKKIIKSSCYFYHKYILFSILY